MSRSLTARIERLEGGGDTSTRIVWFDANGDAEEAARKSLEEAPLAAGESLCLVRWARNGEVPDEAA